MLRAGEATEAWGEARGGKEDTGSKDLGGEIFASAEL
jgi:hypothetical protein